MESEAVQRCLKKLDCQEYTHILWNEQLWPEDEAAGGDVPRPVIAGDIVELVPHRGTRGLIADLMLRVVTVGAGVRDLRTPVSVGTTVEQYKTLKIVDRMLRAYTNVGEVQFFINNAYLQGRPWKNGRLKAEDRMVWLMPQFKQKVRIWDAWAIESDDSEEETDGRGPEDVVWNPIISTSPSGTPLVSP